MIIDEIHAVCGNKARGLPRLALGASRGDLPGVLPACRSVRNPAAARGGGTLSGWSDVVAAAPGERRFEARPVTIIDAGRREDHGPSGGPGRALIGGGHFSRPAQGYLWPSHRRGDIEGHPLSREFEAALGPTTDSVARRDNETSRTNPAQGWRRVFAGGSSRYARRCSDCFVENTCVKFRTCPCTTGPREIATIRSKGSEPSRTGRVRE